VCDIGGNKAAQAVTRQAQTGFNSRRLPFSRRGGGVGIPCSILPATLGPELLGQSWSAAQRVAIPLAVGSVATGVTMGATMALRLAAAKYSLRARLIVSILMIVCARAGAGAVLGGGFGAAAGLAVALWLGVVGWWR
jgi:hypothetical protein